MSANAIVIAVRCHHDNRAHWFRKASGELYHVCWQCLDELVRTSSAFQIGEVCFRDDFAHLAQLLCDGVMDGCQIFGNREVTWDRI